MAFRHFADPCIHPSDITVANVILSGARDDFAHPLQNTECVFFTSNKTQMKSHLPVKAMTLDVVGRHELLWTIKVQLELMVFPDSCFVFQAITWVLTTVVTDVMVVRQQARCQNQFVTAVLLASGCLRDGLGGLPFQEFDTVIF
jgi:hypothetical protein